MGAPITVYFFIGNDQKVNRNDPLDVGVYCFVRPNHFHLLKYRSVRVPVNAVFFQCFFKRSELSWCIERRNRRE